MSFQRASLEEALRSFGAVLEARATPHAILVVGGGNLLLLGLVERPTADLDVVALKEGGTTAGCTASRARSRAPPPRWPKRSASRPVG